MATLLKMFRMGVYGPAIAVVNLLLLISSTVLVYLGSVLTNFYLLPTIGTFMQRRHKGTSGTTLYLK